MTDTSIVLITGGNTGIGYETVKALYASPKAHTILMGSRSLDKAAEAISSLESEIPCTNSNIIPLQIDIESDASIESAFALVASKFDHIDALVNNAGKNKNPTSPSPLQAQNH
jgi:NAD(P)-dependent dehydrogenase (short-subunit alcohol dehydrogenase family)